ncbi:hypothetical protein ScPMuIL_002505 [Solemya velum]
MIQPLLLLSALLAVLVPVYCRPSYPSPIKRRGIYGEMPDSPLIRMLVDEFFDEGDTSYNGLLSATEIEDLIRDVLGRNEDFARRKSKFYIQWGDVNGDGQLNPSELRYAMGIDNIERWL